MLQDELQLLIQVMPSLLEGMKTTLALFAIVLVLSLPLGFLIGIVRVFGPKWLQAIIKVYIFVMRGTPLLLQLMFFFFGLPFIGITLDRFEAAVWAYVINYAAYLAEIYRGGFESIPDSQYESIEVLGIGAVRGFRRIIAPQVNKIVLPSVGNEVISLLKDTSLIHVIGLGEVLRAGQSAVNTYASLTPFIGVGILYLIVTAVITWILDRVETRQSF